LTIYIIKDQHLVDPAISLDHYQAEFLKLVLYFWRRSAKRES